MDGLGVLYLAEAAVFTGPLADQGVLAILGFEELGGSLMGVDPVDCLAVADRDGGVREEGIEPQLIVSVRVLLVVHGDLDDKVLGAAFQQLHQVGAVGVGVVQCAGGKLCYPHELLYALHAVEVAGLVPADDLLGGFTLGAFTMGSLGGGDGLVHFAIVDPFIPLEYLLDVEGDLLRVIAQPVGLLLLAVGRCPWVHPQQ